MQYRLLLVSLSSANASKIPLLSSLEGIWKPYPKNISVTYFAFSKAFHPLSLSNPFLYFLVII